MFSYPWARRLISGVCPIKTLPAPCSSTLTFVDIPVLSQVPPITDATSVASKTSQLDLQAIHPWCFLPHLPTMENQALSRGGCLRGEEIYIKHSGKSVYQLGHLRLNAYTSPMKLHPLSLSNGLQSFHCNYRAVGIHQLKNNLRSQRHAPSPPSLSNHVWFIFQSWCVMSHHTPPTDNPYSCIQQSQSCKEEYTQLFRTTFIHSHKPLRSWCKCIWEHKLPISSKFAFLALTLLLSFLRDRLLVGEYLPFAPHTSHTAHDLAVMWQRFQEVHYYNHGQHPSVLLVYS